MIRDALVTLSHRYAIEAIDTVRSTLRYPARVGVGADSLHTQFCESFDAVAFKNIGTMLNEVVRLPFRAFSVFARD